MSEFYRADEISKKLKVSLPAVYKWCREGKLPSYRFGKSLRVSADDLERFLKERRIVGKRRGK